MSIVTMKNKTKATKNISSTKEIFSLKGTIRNHRGIGSNLYRSESRTIFKGTSPTGYGSLSSTTRGHSEFPLHILSNNRTQVNIQSTPSSAMTSKGLLMSKVYHPTRGCPTWWVKDFNPLAKTQSEYISKLKIGCSTEDDSSVPSSDHCQNAYFIGTRKILKSTYYNTSSSGAITSGEFTEINVLRNNCLPTPPCKKPFPFILNKNGCNTEYITPQQAQHAGLLPANWMNCNETSSRTKAIYTKNPYS